MKRIVLNTTSSRLEELQFPHKMEFIRFQIRVNNVDFIDGKNINSSRLNTIMLNSPATPSATTPTSVDEMIDIFRDLEERKFTDVFVVAISSAFSKSFENFEVAKSLYKGNLNIYIYDTKAATLMEAALAFEADQLLQQGKSFLEIAARLNQLRQNCKLMMTVSSLDYLIANKKMSSTAGLFANFLNIKPVIELSPTGELVAIKKVRKTEKCLEFLAEYYRNMKAQGAYIYLMGGGNDNLNDYFSALLAQKYGMPNLPIINTSTITTANHGPNMVGIGCFLGEPPMICKYFDTFKR